ncbi:PREDICTED: F-box/LRR-repeat protein At4g14103-like [Prunus mume]|uniref:F-box/LRR-repeat protein At4g14103-like n=1 Tax=Prunus mume TaxID=102107 RepID=A0ABM0N9M2_PRUMU|nr:PREDICTED: F-box/LRR-repeat protein At4g14103-like [Prunus mume]
MPGQDRISQLPNGLRSHILSFLPIEDAVATSILSREWHNIWILVSVINVYDDSIPVDEDRFYAIVNSILRHPMAALSPLHKFILKCDEWTSHAAINNLIWAALDRQVKELDLCIAQHAIEGKFPLPVEVYRNQHLKVLKLSGVRVHDDEPPGSFPPGSFPSLKNLQVDISIGCDESLRKFYHHCPVLEELRMEGELDTFPEANCQFDVSSESLKALYIKLQSNYDVQDDDDEAEIYTFKITANNLESLFNDEDVLADYEMEEMISLVEGNIQIGWEDYQYGMGGREFFDKAFKIMRGLTHARTLTLGERTTGALGYAVHLNYVLDREEDDDEDELMWDEDVHTWDEDKVWELCREKIPEFHHLKILNLSMGNRYGWNLLPYLLGFFPRLETLRLEMVHVYRVDPNNRFAWNPPLEKPRCLMETIIRVEVKGFRNEDGEGWPLINYLQEISTHIREFQIIVE